ncbi:hypothetical protein V8F06_013019 [Rhypophila decipiens]
MPEVGTKDDNMKGVEAIRKLISSLPRQFADHGDRARPQVDRIVELLLMRVSDANASVTHSPAAAAVGILAAFLAQKREHEADEREAEPQCDADFKTKLQAKILELEQQAKASEETRAVEAEANIRAKEAELQQHAGEREQASANEETRAAEFEAEVEAKVQQLQQQINALRSENAAKFEVEVQTKELELRQQAEGRQKARDAELQVELDEARQQAGHYTSARAKLVSTLDEHLTRSSSLLVVLPRRMSSSRTSSLAKGTSKQSPTGFTASGVLMNNRSAEMDRRSSVITQRERELDGREKVLDGRGRDLDEGVNDLKVKYEGYNATVKSFNERLEKNAEEAQRLTNLCNQYNEAAKRWAIRWTFL